MTGLLLSIAAALACGLFFLRIHAPGGMLVGTILGAALVHLLVGGAEMDPWMRVAAQILMGSYIGCMLTWEDIRRLPRVLGPYLTVMLSFLLLSLGVGALIWRMTELDLLSALLCAAPGGMTDMPLIALDMGADVSSVTAMQFVRMLFGLGCLPAVVQLSSWLLEGRGSRRARAAAPVSGAPVVQTAAPDAPVTRSAAPVAPDTKAAPRGSLLAARTRLSPAAAGQLAVVLAVCTLAGILGRFSGFPAGAMVFSVVAASGFKLTRHVGAMPMPVRRLAQLITGCCIGTSFTLEQLAELRRMLVPAVILMAGYLLVCVGMGLFIHRVFGMSLQEAMLCLSPAGATEMALIAGDMGVKNTTNLVVMQVCRLVGVILFFPQIYLLIVKFAG